MNAPTVLLIEQNTPNRQRLARIVDEHPKLDLLAALGTCTEARRYLAASASPRAMLLSLRLPDGDGIELIRESRSCRSPPEVMVITTLNDGHQVLRAIQAGANGYLQNDTEPGAIGTAIVHLLGGGSPISPAAARHVLRHLRTPAAGRRDASEASPQLTPREREVLSLLARGHSNGEIAQALGASYHTVTSHVRHLCRKLQAHSRGTAVYTALRLGLLDLDG